MSIFKVNSDNKLYLDPNAVIKACHVNSKHAVSVQTIDGEDYIDLYNLRDKLEEKFTKHMILKENYALIPGFNDEEVEKCWNEFKALAEAVAEVCVHACYEYVSTVSYLISESEKNDIKKCLDAFQKLGIEKPKADGLGIEKVNYAFIIDDVCYIAAFLANRLSN